MLEIITESVTLKANTVEEIKTLAEIYTDSLKISRGRPALPESPEEIEERQLRDKYKEKKNARFKFVPSMESAETPTALEWLRNWEKAEIQAEIPKFEIAG